MEKQTVDLIVGKKLDAQDTQKAQAEPQRVGEGSLTPPQGGEVEGHSGYAYVSEPNCGAINYVYVDDNVYTYYRCGRCGGLFKV